jgi:hypothetical protein
VRDSEVFAQLDRDIEAGQVTPERLPSSAVSHHYEPPAEEDSDGYTTDGSDEDEDEEHHLDEIVDASPAFC